MCLRARAYPALIPVKVRTGISHCQSSSVRLFGTSLHPFRIAVRVLIPHPNSVSRRIFHLCNSAMPPVVIHLRPHRSAISMYHGQFSARCTRNRCSARRKHFQPAPRDPPAGNKSAVAHRFLSTSPLTLQFHLFYVRLRQARGIRSCSTGLCLSSSPDTDV